MLTIIPEVGQHLKLKLVSHRILVMQNKVNLVTLHYQNVLLIDKQIQPVGHRGGNLFTHLSLASFLRQ